ncbi:MAG: HAD-IIB family hydrolase [bacterium]|nr:HAD-IIB family hydrolase [bacterium]
MIKKYKALILDVDGTLIPNKRDGMPSEKVTKAINKASKLIHIGIASSRPYFLLKHIFGHLKLSGLSIMNGGAQIIDLNSKKILWERQIDRNDFKNICKILDQEKIPYFVHDGEKDIKINPETAQKAYNIVSIELENHQAELAMKKIAHISTVSIFKVPDWKEDKISFLISHSEATKQHAILKIAELLRINTREIIGVGDGYNDFPLLMACGLKIAMGNAVPDLKAIADYIAPTVEEDGVADVINKFVLNTFEISDS